MTAYRLISTRHNVDGSVETPSANLTITARDDDEALARAREVSVGCFADDADFAWLVDDTGRVAGSFPIAFGRAA